MVCDSNIVSSNSASNLGIIFDKCIKLDYHISSVCKSTYFHLRNIGGIRNILSNDACAQLIHSLVTVRLDYCNSILYGLPDNSLYRLQKIQNTVARILARLPRFSHISATLFDLHWLPIKYRIPFKKFYSNISGIELHGARRTPWVKCPPPLIQYVPYISITGGYKQC